MNAFLIITLRHPTPCRPRPKAFARFEPDDLLLAAPLIPAVFTPGAHSAPPVPPAPVRYALRARKPVAPQSPRRRT